MSHCSLQAGCLCKQRSSHLNPLFKQQSPRAAPVAPAARHQPPVLSVPCGAGLLPAGLADRWQAAAPSGGMLVVSAAQGVHSRRDCGKIAFEIPILQALCEPTTTSSFTQSLGQALRVSLVKPGAYLSESYREED